MVERTVVCTIHQPSYRIFRGFDVVVLLAQGRIAYSGSPKRLVNHLEAAGLACPEFENPADHSMRLLQDEEGLAKLFEAYKGQTTEGGDEGGGLAGDVEELAGILAQQRPYGVWQVSPSYVLFLFTLSHHPAASCRCGS